MNICMLLKKTIKRCRTSIQQGDENITIFQFIDIFLHPWCNLVFNCCHICFKQHLLIYFILSFCLFFQMKNAFDNLFEGLMESKDGEQEAAKVCVSFFCILLIRGNILFFPWFLYQYCLKCLFSAFSSKSKKQNNFKCLFIVLFTMFRWTKYKKVQTNIKKTCLE